MLSYPGMTIQDLQNTAKRFHENGQSFEGDEASVPPTPPLLDVDPEAQEAVQVELKYADYLK